MLRFLRSGVAQILFARYGFSRCPAEIRTAPRNGAKWPIGKQLLIVGRMIEPRFGMAECQCQVGLMGPIRRWRTWRSSPRMA